ncbi:MAG: 50S ribosome-binding GTPase, partial [Alphaproteobacteria bacterium]|nr:50S ribosome-binding GTPase [Alphaproteobacteria bacterium]
MQNTPKSLRLQIAISGRVNSGKSSFLNLVCGQNISITSDISGTTTDVVEKAMELAPLGAVLFMDTAGLGDDTNLKNQRKEKTTAALQKADIILLVCEGDFIGEEEQNIINEAQKNNTPLLKIYNKADKFTIKATDGLALNSL